MSHDDVAVGGLNVPGLVQTCWAYGNFYGFDPTVLCLLGRIEDRSEPASPVKRDRELHDLTSRLASTFDT
ncbi:hypothetical protein J6590_040695 [Homalodisca vitripennis]|nr:hypothetical protein J6590_040695 [Homalodisca vitripennis]